MVAETPAEHDRRKAAPLDFEPECEIQDCEQRASQGIRCVECGSVQVLLCGAHAGISQRRMKDDNVLCEACGAEGLARTALEWRPLQGWFA